MKLLPYFSLVFLLSFSACSESATTTSDSLPEDSVTTPPVVRTDSVARRPDSVVAQPGKPSPDKTSPMPDMGEGKVFYNKTYCGGMKPTDEMVEELRKWQPLPNSTLRLVNGAGEFLVKTDRQGNFTSIMPPGNYKVYLTKETDPAIYDVGPDACENCLTQPMTNVEIRIGKKSEIRVTFRCGPQDKRRQ